MAEGDCPIFLFIHGARYVGDVFENQPINPRIVPGPVYAPGEFAEFVGRLQSRVREFIKTNAF